MRPRAPIRTLEHRTGILKVVSAGTTESAKKFLRVESPLGGNKKYFKVVLVSDDGWLSDAKVVEQMWNELTFGENSDSNSSSY